MPVRIDALTVTEILAPLARTSTVNGSAIDTHDYSGYYGFILTTTAGTGTSPTLDGKIQDSDDGSTGWADVTGATFTQVTDAADATEAIYVDVDSTKAYIRFVGTIGGTTPSFTCAVVGIGQTQSY